MKAQTQSEFKNWTHRFGRSSSLVLLALMAGFPVAISMIYNLWPPFLDLLPAFFAVFLLMGPYWPGETIGYMPVLGPGALYMGYVAGNVTNLRLPATVGTLNILGIKPNTEDSHVMAIIACGASVITTVGMLLIAVLISKPLEPILSKPELQPAFNYAVPALMGSLVAQSILHSKRAVAVFMIPLAINIILTRTTKIDWSVVLLLGLICAVAADVAIYFKVDKKKKSN